MAFKMKSPYAKAAFKNYSVEKGSHSHPHKMAYGPMKMNTPTKKRKCK